MRLELVGTVLAEAGGDERAGLRGTDGLARARFREDDMPKVDVRRDESDADKTAFVFFAQRSDVAVRPLGGHLIENPHRLTREQRRIHKQECTMSADDVSGGL